MRDILGIKVGITVDHAHEASLRYKDSIIGLKSTTDDSIIPFMIQDIKLGVDNEVNWIGRKWSKKNLMWREDSNMLNYQYERLIYDAPTPGYINISNTHKTTAYLEKFPAKQYKRGFSWDQYILLQPFSRSYSLLKVPVENYRSRTDYVLHDIFNREFYPLERLIINIMDAKQISGAFHTDFAASVNPGLKYPVIYYKQFMIGVIHPDTLEIKLGSEAEDLGDLLQTMTSVKIVI